MEGPSLYLTAKLFAPFIGGQILAVEGNTKIGKERLINQTILDIFSWGKHLIFQFEGFALRVHFLLYGSYQAIREGRPLQGDYPLKPKPPRLKIDLPNGTIFLFSCSVKYLETSQAKSQYDFKKDLMSAFWDESQAIELILESPQSEIGDLLLDQNIFAGLGNIMKNEVLFLAKKLPTRTAQSLTLSDLKKITRIARRYAWFFLKWRKRFELKKHYQVYRQINCPVCQTKIKRQRTGKWQRMSFFCVNCQK